MGKFGEESDTYTVRLVMETAQAWLVDDGEDSDAPQVWLPKSQRTFPRACHVGKLVDVEVPNWLAEEKGLLG